MTTTAVTPLRPGSVTRSLKTLIPLIQEETDIVAKEAIGT